MEGGVPRKKMKIDIPIKMTSPKINTMRILGGKEERSFQIASGASRTAHQRVTKPITPASKGNMGSIKKYSKEETSLLGLPAEKDQKKNAI
ncbi:MAG: hypothetical protein ACE5FY_06680 [Nitrospiria bacterium]